MYCFDPFLKQKMKAMFKPDIAYLEREIEARAAKDARETMTQVWADQQ